MVIGGWQKNSFIDYPGKISCVLFLSGCNFDCPYCFNPDLVKNSPKNVIDLNRVYDFLKNRKGLLDGVVISGGEPTLHEELFLLCEKIRQMGFSIKLDTNGSRPHVIKKLIRKGMVDYIAMDIKTDPVKYPFFIQKNSNPDHILSSINIIMESSLDYEFRTTCIKPLVDAKIIDCISRRIKGATLYALQQFQHTKVLHPEFFAENERRYTDTELFHLKDIAKVWVKKCIVR
ncbi:MAG: anaerobic ribonucleoside-triphosphate reductase activating protein [Desulfobacterales bacterium]|nr:MAG: anaerobic ribonucleoside-triphosphate reductase activating protein [Desulfobacterales bacterium]